MSDIRVDASANRETGGLTDRSSAGLGGAALHTAPPLSAGNDAVPTAEVFTEVLRGQATAVVVGLHPHPEPVQATRWRADADRVDRRLLAYCHGPTIDLGCGPGRMTAYLQKRGIPALAVDSHPEAVAQARARGVAVLQRDVFDTLPGEGRWSSALLVDGNIGIGGDPVRLLRRTARLIDSSGTVLVETAPPGAGLHIRTAHLRTARRRSHQFPWAVVGADALGRVAACAGLAVTDLLHYDNRFFGVLRHAGREAPCLV